MRQLRRIMSLAIATVFLGQATACGTLFHPERRGQEAGKLDTDIVLLDGVGLLFFLVPGVEVFESGAGGNITERLAALQRAARGGVALAV
ncbi:MAG: hypothetical protein QNK03_03040 [Myxococcota bacterium]|nr:hypothetical protein [Myxococcota bacterium]